MAISWKVGDQVFYRPLGTSQCRSSAIRHIWPDHARALLCSGDLIALSDETLPAPPGIPADLVMASIDELAAAFTEWDRRYREEPERFMSEGQHLLRETPQTYGQACAPYLLKILNELGSPS